MSSTFPTNKKASRALLELLLRQEPRSSCQGVPSTTDRFSEREPQNMSPNWLPVTSATQSWRPAESWLHSLLPENPVCPLGPAPLLQGESGGWVLVHLSSSLPSFSGCQQAPAVPCLLPAAKGTQLALQALAGCAQVAVRKISFDLICKLSRVIETK